MAVKLDGRSAPARLALGNALLETGRAAEALPAYQLAVSLDGGNVSAWRGLAKALAMAGRNNDAGEALRRAAELGRP